jgi:hypothetical protein
MAIGQLRKSETTMAPDDVGEEPDSEPSSVQADESAGRRLENEPPRSPPRALRSYVPLVVPVILAAAFNVIALGFNRSGGPGRELIDSFAAGVIAGEVGLLAIWAVLGPWRLYSQWSSCLLVWLGLLVAIVCGLKIAGEGPPDGNVILQLMLGYSAALVAAQVPLGLIRLLRGWRLLLRTADAGRTAIESRQLQIRDMLIAMTVLGLFLGTMNIVAKGSHGVIELPFLVLILCGVAVVWSALVLPICVWVCFGASRIKLRIIGLIGYLTAAATIAVGVSVVVSGRKVPEGAIPAVLLHVALFATVLSGVGLARACGYVLVSVRSARRQDPVAGR